MPVTQSLMPRLAVLLVTLLVAGCPPGENGGSNGGDDTGAPDVVDTGGGGGDTAGDDTGELTDTGGTDTGDPASDTSGDDTSTDSGGEDTDPGDDADGGADSELAEAVERVSQLQADIYCNAAYECPQKLARSENEAISRFGDAETCRQEFFSVLGSSIQDQIDRLQSDIDAGLSSFDADQAETCIQTLETRAQDADCRNIRNFFSTVPACESVIVGTQPQGEPCNRDSQCQSINCDSGANPNECYGACASPPQEVGQGESCGGSDRRCDPSNQDIFCTSTPSGTGRICKEFGNAAEDEACFSPFDCPSGISCVEETCQEATIKAQGESCDQPGHRCDLGLVCTQTISGSGANEMISTSCEPPRSPGESCYTASVCERGLYCDGAEYRPSTPDDSSPGSCTELLADGSSCDSNAQCASRNCDGGNCQPSATPSCELPSDG